MPVRKGVVVMTEKKRPHEVRERPLTYDDYANLPDDGNRYELDDGVLELMSPSASAKHQMVSFQIEKRLAQRCETEYVILHAPLDVILSPYEVRQPDIIMIHRSRLNIITKRGIEGPPDLVVEILSPSSLKRDKVRKRHAYARYLIPEYWIVDTANGALEQYVLRLHAYEIVELYQHEDAIHSEHIPCVSFTMKEIMDAIPELPD
jgi:Uma2 family endonuclease